MYPWYHVERVERILSPFRSYRYQDAFVFIDEFEGEGPFDDDFGEDYPPKPSREGSLLAPDTYESHWTTVASFQSAAAALSCVNTSFRPIPSGSPTKYILKLSEGENMWRNVATFFNVEDAARAMDSLITRPGQA